MSLSAIIGYEFENQALMIRACTNVSKDSVVNNGFLVEIGAKTLYQHVGTHFIKTNPRMPNSEKEVLTLINIDNETLARACLRCGLDGHLRHDAMNEVKREISRFRQDLQKYPAHSNGRLDVPNYLAVLVKAIVGAVWIDSRVNIVKIEAVIRRILGDQLNTDYENYKLRPYELFHSVQKKYGLSENPPNNKNDIGMKRYMILMNREVIAEVSYNGSYQVLKNRVAYKAIEYLRKSGRQI